MYSLLKKNSAYFIPYLLFVLSGIICIMLWSKIDISLFINGHHSPASDFFFSYWTNVGLGYLIIPVLIVLAFVSLRGMIMAATAYLLAFGINDSLKFSIGAPRPSILFDQLHLTFYHVPGVEIMGWDSFPSGHTAISFSVFCLLALISNKKILKFIFFMMAFLVGYSRIYLAEHFITDVIAASAIGTACAVLTYKVMMNWKALNKFTAIDKPLISFSK